MMWVVSTKKAGRDGTAVCPRLRRRTCTAFNPYATICKGQCLRWTKWLGSTPRSNVRASTAQHAVTPVIRPCFRGPAPSPRHIQSLVMGMRLPRCIFLYRESALFAGLLAIS